MAKVLITENDRSISRNVGYLVVQDGQGLMTPPIPLSKGMRMILTGGFRDPKSMDRTLVCIHEPAEVQKMVLGNQRVHHPLKSIYDPNPPRVDSWFTAIMSSLATLVAVGLYGFISNMLQ